MMRAGVTKCHWTSDLAGDIAARPEGSWNIRQIVWTNHVKVRVVKAVLLNISQVWDQGTMCETLVKLIIQYGS